RRRRSDRRGAVRTRGSRRQSGGSVGGGRVTEVPPAASSHRRVHNHTRTAQEFSMDKDRVEGAVEQAKGKVKEVAGKVTGDSKLEAEGKADQVAGKIQNAVGGIKDTLRGK